MSGSSQYRIEKDSMGELRVPADALWGAQTQRAIDNFPISGQGLPRGFIRALGLVKAAAASVNARLGYLDGERAAAIRAAPTSRISRRRKASSISARLNPMPSALGSGSSSARNVPP